jgi:hypothetical protein
VKQSNKNLFKGRQFTAEIILWAGRWYLQFPISYRDLERMFSDRGIQVDHNLRPCPAFVSPASGVATDPELLGQCGFRGKLDHRQVFSINSLLASPTAGGNPNVTPSWPLLRVKQGAQIDEWE